MRNIRVDGQRLWDSLMEMAKIGALPNGGCGRLTLTDEDREGRDLFVRWCEQAGCTVTIDRMGNIFARRLGSDPDRPPVVTGSHLDTQPHGGKFDGVYGVLSGLEIVRTLNDADIETAAPIEVAVWTNEEGARFAPSMIGSGVFAGVYEIDFAHGQTDTEGNLFGAELERIGYAGPEPCGGRPFTASFEVHIEQGPILEREECAIGVVTGVQGMRWFDLTLKGQDSHAGPTPMEGRRDCLVAAASIITAVNNIAKDHAPNGRGTVGQLDVSPNSRNTVPGEVFLTVDLRHPEAATLEALEGQLRAASAAAALSAGVSCEIEKVMDNPPVVFEEACVESVRMAAKQLGYEHMDVVSGAGHDSCHIADVAPTSMIFIPCDDGLSHAEAENAHPEHITAGCNVLLHAILERAG